MKRLSPAASKAASNSQEVRRNVYCRHYNTCLDFTILKNWDGFTCEGCRGYERETLTAEDAFEECVRCAALVYLIIHPGSDMDSYDLSGNIGRKPRKTGFHWTGRVGSSFSSLYA
jgi:hypothetical protein